MCVCILNGDPMIQVLLYHIVLYCVSFAPNGEFAFSAFLILRVFYTCLMKSNKVETDRELLT